MQSLQIYIFLKFSVNIHSILIIRKLNRMHKKNFRMNFKFIIYIVECYETMQEQDYLSIDSSIS